MARGVGFPWFSGQAAEIAFTSAFTCEVSRILRRSLVRDVSVGSDVGGIGGVIEWLEVEGDVRFGRFRESAHPRFKGQIQAQNSLHGSGRRKPYSFNHIAYQLPYCK
jgi:hypothetical protein